MTNQSLKTEELSRMAAELRILMSIMRKRSGLALEQRLHTHSIKLSELQYHILQVLNYQPHTSSELSRIFMLNPSPLVPAVDALEKKGLIQRGRDPHDRRRIPLTLTEQGARVVSDVSIVDQEDPIYQGLNGMGQEQAQQLVSLLRQLVRQQPDGEGILRGVADGIQRQMTIVGEIENDTQ